MLKNLPFLFLLLLLSSTAAADLRLVEWHTKQTLAPLIIPVRSSESPEQASQRYLNNLAKSPDLMELFLGQVPHLETVEFRELDARQRESRILLLANAMKDTTLKSDRIIHFQRYFGKAKHSSYILPVNSNLGLSIGETRELFQRIADSFPMLVAMGGEDVEPSLYKSKNIHSINVISERDQFEMRLIKSYVASEKGFVLGICRGSQLTAVALGYKLVQDIPTQIKSPMDHKDTTHIIKTLPTSFSILQNAVAGQNNIIVRSLHHQMVIHHEGGPLELAAVAPDGVVEATEFKNGRGLLLQFHPELMHWGLGAQILSHAIKMKNTFLPKSCRGVFL